jgi:hypothetical protein
LLVFFGAKAARPGGSGQGDSCRRDSAEEAKTQSEEATLVQYFLKRGGYPFLLGALAKTGAKTWCFGGEFVAVCVVNVVIKQPLTWALKIRHRFWIYFLGFPLWNTPGRGLREQTFVTVFSAQAHSISLRCRTIPLPTKFGALRVGFRRNDQSFRATNNTQASVSRHNAAG